MGFCRRRRLEAHLQQHAKDVEQGLTHNSAPQDSRLGMGGTEAKDFLMSMGLGTAGAMDGSGGGRLDGSAGSVGGGDGRGSGSSSSTKGIASAGMAVFPGFNMEEKEAENEDDGNIAEINNHDSDTSGQTVSRSPTPSPCHSQTPTSTSKSRRKPAFVRKLGSAPSQKTEVREDFVSSGKAEENTVDARKVELSAQEAAVKAMIRMATGSDCDDVGDVSLNDVTSLDASISSMLLKHTFFGVGSASTLANSLPVNQDPRSSTKFSSEASPTSQPPPPPHPSSNTMLSSLIRTNNRVSLVDFTAEDLLRHLMSRDDVYRCDFCCVIFHDAAMYHLHRSMHDKMDIRCCNLCGKLLTDKYDFTAHFLSQHK